MKNLITVLDTTLRDGEQTPGIALTPVEKLEIARALDEIGVDIIEAGAAITSEGEKKAIKSIAKAGLDAEICSFARALRTDVDAALECEVDSVHLVVPSSDIHILHKLGKKRNDVKKMAYDAAEYAIDHGLKVEFSAEDASRADEKFLLELLKGAEEIGVHRACLCDTVGVLSPNRAKEMFSFFSSQLKLPLATHCHNDLGLATANTLAAVEGGAKEVHVTVNGLGERGGNASLEEVVLGVHRFLGKQTRIKFKQLYPTSKLVEKLTKFPISPLKPIVGENAFAHEAGIHTHGVLKYPPTYEPISPEMVGQRRRIVFGKHVGSHAIENELKKLGFKFTKKEVQEIFNQVKRLGDSGKLVTDTDLRSIIDSIMGARFEEVIKLEELTVVSGNKITPTASVRVKVNGKDMVESGFGVGPVDAAMNAIRKVVEETSNIRLQEFHVDAISGGTDAVVNVIVKLSDGKKLVTARGTSGDIIMASVQAVLNGVNRLLWDRKRG
ncbi:MAG: 2-isopropylmalate synthase [Candidatus Hadarchaeales archaeon]